MIMDKIQAITFTARALCIRQTVTPIFMQMAGLKLLQMPPKKENIEYPERRRLRVLPKVPQYPPGTRNFKMMKRLHWMRGPELVHNKLIHGQYGIVALSGGRLKHSHIEMIRFGVLKKLDESRMFAIWRIDPPWQAVSKKSLGVRMGGGKGAIDHYVTPVKAGRVIIEVAGNCEYIEVKKMLTNIAAKLPFKAKAVSQEILENDKKKEEWLEQNNQNPFTWKYIIQNNIGGCHNWISPIDKRWFNKYI